jgi:hypothetical protein
MKSKLSSVSHMIQFEIRATWVFRTFHLTEHIHSCKKWCLRYKKLKMLVAVS